ncbi:MAG: hypothetical protein PHD43_15080 [Methylococcales bacterium]|nr:hypothetical protein [Methylococcales bacterium]
MKRVRSLKHLLLLVAIATTAAMAGKVTMSPLCGVTENNLVVTTIIESRQVGGHSKKRQGPWRELWNIRCSLQLWQCQAANLHLEQLDKGELLSPLAFNLAIDMKIVGAKGSVYTLVWGPFRTFSVDLVQKKVIYRVSTGAFEGLGEGPCN